MLSGYPEPMGRVDWKLVLSKIIDTFDMYISIDTRYSHRLQHSPTETDIVRNAWNNLSYGMHKIMLKDVLHFSM